MTTMRLSVLALAVAIFTGCASTNNDGVRTPNNQDSTTDRMVKEKHAWDGPGLTK